jgi:hypothetical protein
MVASERPGRSASHLLATVTWDLLDEVRTSPLARRESYLLVDLDGRLRVRTSTDHLAAG